MTSQESDQLVAKITAGIKLAIQRLIEHTKRKTMRSGFAPEFSPPDSQI